MSRSTRQNLKSESEDKNLCQKRQSLPIIELGKECINSIFCELHLQRTSPL